MSSPGPTTVIEWSVIFAAVAWIARQVAEYFRSKEKSEGNLIMSLINDLRTTQKDLIEELKNGQLEVIEKISMQQTLAEITVLTRSDLQRSLQTQTAMYAELMERIAKLDQKIDALHRRLDNREDIEIMPDPRTAKSKQLYPSRTSDMD